MLVCENCGATNEGKLTFCRTCGDRLGKVAAPPPAVALDVANAASKDASAAPRTVRPSAPPLTLGRSRESKPAPSVAQAAAPDPVESVPADGLRCEQCSVLSPKDYRFCVGCGSVLARKRDIAPAALANAMMRSRRASSRPAGALGESTGNVGAASETTAARQPQQKLQAEAEVLPEARRPSETVKPAPQREPEEVTGRLVVIVEDGSEGTTLELRGRQMDIGGREGDIILEEDRFLSPRHARLFRQDDAWYLRDLNSLNGIYRRLRKPEVLRDGSLFLLGLEVLQFHSVNHAERGLGQAVENGVLLFGSPATPRRARLSQRTVEGITRDVYHLITDETTIGRELGDIVFTGDPFMSRRHAMVSWNGTSEEYVLSDLSSSNGTFLAIREDIRLENGDFIRLGQHLFRVDLAAFPTVRR